MTEELHAVNDIFYSKIMINIFITSIFSCINILGYLIKSSYISKTYMSYDRVMTFLSSKLAGIFLQDTVLLYCFLSFQSPDDAFHAKNIINADSALSAPPKIRKREKTFDKLPAKLFSVENFSSREKIAL